jgi:tRNA U34 2-thiouridine synthase MnmA/TrmU
MVINFKKNIDNTNKLESKKTKKLLGLGLVSGGLDSLIACLILKLQNIDTIGLNFKSPFCIIK